MSQPYKKLFTYWFSVIIYDLTVEFCAFYIKSWKLKEQMIGAARSGKQNIVEGSDNMSTSLKVAINLTGIAKGSIEELIGDLEDCIRQNKLNQWKKTDIRVQEFRSKSAKLVKDLSHLRNLSNVRYLSIFEENNTLESLANLLLTLCHQATYLLFK